MMALPAHFLALEKDKAFVGLYVCKSTVFL